MPKLWNDTIDAHRAAVRDAVLDGAWTLVRESGLGALTMTRIAQEAGIGRATLYKYFRDVEAVLTAWHERHVAGHIEALRALKAQGGEPGERLEAVLGTYARIVHERGRHGPELVALLHRGDHVGRAQQHLAAIVRGLLEEMAEAGSLRTDAPPDELAAFCLHALEAAGAAISGDAIGRLVAVTLSALRPQA